MFENKECSNGTEKGCILKPGSGINEEELDEWLEETVWHGMRMWHVIFLAMGAVLSFIILLCCCFKFRIPRTKQEIEGDYIRRKIMRKFRKRLKAIQNQELDEMDLKKALDKIRTELKSDTESLQQSDVLSGATLSSAGGINPNAGSTYRRASQIQIDISLEDLRIQSMGLGARIALAFTRFFGRANKGTQPAESDEENGGAGMGDTGNDKPTTALIPPKKQGAAASTTTKAGGGGDDASKKKKEESKGKEEQKIEDASTSKGKASKTAAGAKGDDKGKKEKKKEPATTPAAAAAVATTTVVTTEKETGSGDKKQDKKSNKENNKEKKPEKEQKKSKTSGESTTTTTATAANNSKEGAEKGQKTGTITTATSSSDKKSNESQKKK